MGSDRAFSRLSALAPVVDVYTDNNPLVYVLSSAKVKTTGQRWVNQLADFNLTLH